MSELYAQRLPDGKVRVFCDKNLRPEHVRLAECLAQGFMDAREQEVFYSDTDIQVLEEYANAYWDFAERARYQLATQRRKESRCRFVVICTVERMGFVRRYAYQTRKRVTRAEAIAAGLRKHRHAQVTVMPRKAA